MARPDAVPLSLFVLVVLGLLATPVTNVITRHTEAEADWMALETTRDPRGATMLFRRFTRTAYAEPDPGVIEYLVLENHPTIMQRIAMAEAWRVRSAARSAR
jgi:STE24 endopeptidase